MWIIVSVICGIIAAAIASSKGRNVIGWFFVGFLLGLIGIIIALVMSNLKEKEARERQVDMTQRRLREQLRQERLKNESFRRYAANRLDAHDQVLGVDTQIAEALQLDTAQPMQSLPGGAQAPAGPPTPPQEFGALWYYESQGSTQGPVGEGDIRQMLRDREIASDTLLWAEGLGNWTPAGEVPAFRGEATA